MYHRPVPKQIGTLHLTILRDAGSFKFSTTYSLKLSERSTPMLLAEKITQSMTKHYKLKIDLPGHKYTRSEEELYIGRLRANFKCNEFYVYDHG